MTNFLSTLNPLLAIDAYKADHRRHYLLSGHVTRIYSNFTNRGSRIEGVNDVVHFGLQAFLKDFFEDSFRNFFEASEDEVAEEYERRMLSILGPNDIGSDHIRALHRKGYLPLRVKAVPEGTLVPVRVPSFTIENTDPEFFWLTNYIETAVSASVWQASTSATKSLHIRKLLDERAAKTSSAPEFVDWQGHDFSFRGMPGIQAAAASGAAHLLSFKGSDTLAALDWIDYFYPGSPSDEIILGSVPATEHSVMCTGIAKIGEQEMVSRLIGLYPTGLVSIVADSFDFWAVLTQILPALKDKILSRDGKVVIRPDSGDPADIICGTSRVLGADTPEERGAVEVLWDLFGGTVNEKGFKELDPHIGLIYGDSITYERADEITLRLAEKRFASTNVVFGVGSFYFQGSTTRDTFMSAIKATWAEVDGGPVNIKKDPATDSGVKKSATGRLAVLNRMDGVPYLVEQATPEQEAQSLLQTVWEDGKFVRRQPFSDVRATLKRTAQIAARAGR
jgi:nicotinamide phosphoribosyltransferase